MLIIGCDYHTRFQQNATVYTRTGEMIERRLENGCGEAQKFYASLPQNEIFNPFALASPRLSRELSGESLHAASVSVQNLGSHFVLALLP